MNKKITNLEKQCQKAERENILKHIFVPKTCCSKCNKRLSLKQFVNEFSLLGITWCNSCIDKYPEQYDLLLDDKYYELLAKYKESTEKTLLNRKEHRAWRNRNYGFTLLFENIFKDVPTDFHHISDAFVLAIPRDIHRKNNNGNHRGKLKPIVEKLYNFSYIIVENKT